MRLVVLLVQGVLGLADKRKGFYIGNQSMLISDLEFAVMLGVSQRTLKRALDADVIPKPIDMPGHRRWPRSQIEEWIAMGCPSVDKTLDKVGRNWTSLDKFGQTELSL